MRKKGVLLLIVMNNHKRCIKCHIQFHWGIKYKREKGYDRDGTSVLVEYCVRDECGWKRQ